MLENVSEHPSTNTKPANQRELVSVYYLKKNMLLFGLFSSERQHPTATSDSNMGALPFQAAESTSHTIKSLISDSPRSSDCKLRWDKVGDHRQGGHTNKKAQN